MSRDYTLGYSDEGGWAMLTLQRPQARNALSRDLMTALDAALNVVAANRNFKVVVIAGSGSDFCAGHDLREIRALPDRAAYLALFEQCSRLMTRIARFPKVVIAQVHGMATAAGCQLVASADLAIAADTARFATPGVNIGLFCSTPAVALSRAVGRKAALEMLLTGDSIDAFRAREFGLVNRVVPEAELAEAVTELADRITDKSALALAMGKEAFNRQAEMGLDAAYAHASEIMTSNMLTHDAEEGIDAFLAKRRPVWMGR